MHGLLSRIVRRWPYSRKVLLAGLVTFVLAGVGLALLFALGRGGRGSRNYIPARIGAEQALADLGVVDPNDPQNRYVTFRIVNTGGSDLRLDRVKVGCACLEPTLDRALVAPGEKATLRVRLLIPSEPGRWRERILVYSNDPANEVLQLQIIAFRKFRWHVSPAQVAVDPLPENGRREVTLTITGPSGERAFKVLGISAETKAIELAQLEPAGLIEGLDRAVWKARLLIRGRGEPLWEDRVTIRTTDEKTPTIEVPVSVRELGRIRAIPPMLTLKAHQVAGKNSGAEVEIIASDNDFLEISRIENPEWANVELLQGRPGRIRLRATLRRRPPGRIVKGNITLSFKGRGRPLEIPVVVFSHTGEN